MAKIELIKNNIYNFYYKNKEIGKTFFYKAKYVATQGKVIQIYDLKEKDYFILPLDDVTAKPVDKGDLRVY